MDSTTYNTGNLGSVPTGQTVKERVSTAASDLASRASNYIEREPHMGPRAEHREGIVARSLETQTAKIPSDVWLWAAFGSIGISLALQTAGNDKGANFVGHWAPTFLLLGLYNKLVKLQGSDGRF